MRRVALELFPTRHGPLLQLVFAADDLERAALRAVVDGQRQSPVAFLGDHPVVHVAQPVHLAFQAEGWDPPGLTDHAHDLVAQLIHRDVPLIHQAEDQFRLTTPADGIAVFVALRAVEQAFLGQVLRDGLRYF